MIALAALLGRVSEISLLHLILAQTVIALVIFLHVTIDPTYHWATSATLIAAPQLVYLLAELRRACIARLLVPGFSVTLLIPMALNVANWRRKCKLW